MKVIHDTPDKDDIRLQKIKEDVSACAAEFVHCINNDKIDIAIFWLTHMYYDAIILKAYQD